MRLAFTLLLCSTALVACGPSTEVLLLEDTPPNRPPVASEKVAVYRSVSVLPCSYQRVALLESQHSKSTNFGKGVSQIELIRAARAKAGAIGANAMIVESLGEKSFIETQVTADSTGYKRSESRQSWGRGMFLAVYEERPCSPPEGRDDAPSRDSPASRLPVSVSAVDPQVRSALSLPNGAKKITASNVQKLQPEDVILSIDGTDLTQENSFETLLARHSSGEPLRIEVLRRGRSQTVILPLAETH